MTCTCKQCHNKLLLLSTLVHIKPILPHGICLLRHEIVGLQPVPQIFVHSLPLSPLRPLDKKTRVVSGIACTVCCYRFYVYIGHELEVARKKVAELQKCYIDISTRASEEMATSVSIKNLRYSVLCLPSHLKKEHKKFVREAKADLKEADSVDDVFIVVGEHNDYLRYSLLKHLIDLYGSDQLKKEMGDYATRVQTFRMETRLEVFSEVCDDQPEKVNGRFAEMVTKHKMEWARATLEDVERFRIEVCRELSLYDFSLNLLRAERGCVEITWRVPRCLVAYIQKSVKPSSQAMREHHVTSLTIDGFIAYTSTTGRLTFT